MTSSSEGSAVTVTKVPIKASGWRILIEPIAVEEESKGGIVLAEATKEAQRYLRHFGQVLDVGPTAYQDEKFRNRYGEKVPWCKVGDWVNYGRHAGQDIAIKVFDKDGNDTGDVLPLKLVNDDDILAVIDDPRAIVIHL